MKKIAGMQIALFSSIFCIVLVFSLWAGSCLKLEKMLPDYNQFRLKYSGTIEIIENSWQNWSDTEKVKDLEKALLGEIKASDTQLLVYDVKKSTILFSNITDIPHITAKQLQEYLYQDKSMSKLLENGKYLMSYVLFDKGKAVGVSIFIVNQDIVLSGSKQVKASIEKGVVAAGGLILLCVLIYFWVIHRLLTVPLFQLEVEARKIARGQFETPIITKLQTGTLGGCFYELDRMRQDLKEMAETNNGYEQGRKELINYLTHDLRTPIASMRVLTEGLLDGIAVTKESKEQYLKGILKKTEEMERLTNDLFHHANIKLSGFHLELKELYFDEMMANMMLSIEVNFKTYQGTYEISKNHPHKLISADSFRLEQALINLVVNAIKYSPNGEKIRVFTKQIDNYVVITVEDGGIGIGKEDLPFIFENFYRGEKSRSREYGGTGLGLSIVKYIAEAHGGYVTVKSELGKGSAFKLCLPLV
jgi:signal transduction histidine kinase